MVDVMSVSRASEIMSEDGIRNAVHDHVTEWFPKEACGLLVDSQDGPKAVLAENKADKYHSLDPEAYPRTAETAYVLDPLLITKAERAGERVVAIFHSHVRVGAYFSDEDVAQALSPFGEGPLYPGIDYVVLDAQDDGVLGYKVFRWSDTEQGFVGC